ncbi:SDR family NAD(P)-dependent oxidoreductase [Marinomonas pollencensis]|uniref:Short subunit dehydrogenase n=1 Tax=Marinomonas pollencensis TaxID=491954 RepID=A0A3E0DRE1_9GAMM|nr:SDR family NAD(P)-dependent oxidoreductase [Marinomonas pollencensis]REG85671.1 short subunit dehydrogenase [Marinomonas pollencensis]
MKKTILITGSTDGIGFATAKSLLAQGHKVLLHGRSAGKLDSAKAHLSDPNVETYQADLSRLEDVYSLAAQIAQNHTTLDVIINNAGVYMVPVAISEDNLDVRYMVNTIAPYLLTQQLLPLLTSQSRVVNLSSAAQAPVMATELSMPSKLADGMVYAKSKLALTMWSRHMADTLGAEGPVIVAVNPKSFLGSKMVKEAYGVSGGNLQDGADILIRAALSDEFSNASGLYFDNDIGQFSDPHPDALNAQKNAEISQAIERILAEKRVA